jgi:protocatechuate 3,4-dioxygenase beta subunit
MHKPLFAVLAVLSVLAAALLWWQFGAGSGDVSGPQPIAPAATGAPAVPVGAELRGEGAPGSDTAAAGVVAQLERSAAPVDAGFDPSRPAIRGRVVDETGAPIAGARVLAAPGLAFANADGNFDFGNFDPADFEEIGGFDQSGMLDLTKRQLHEAVAVATDADGNFRVQPRGTTRGVGLRVLQPGYQLLDRRAARPAEQDLDVGTLQLVRGGIVRGRVVDDTGQPLPGVRVRRVLAIEGMAFGGADIELPAATAVEDLREGETAVSDAAGRFELRHVPTGPLELRARDEGHPTVRLGELEVQAGAELGPVLITMPRGLEIRGRVLDVPAGITGLQVSAARKPRADADPTGMMGMFGGDMAELLTEAGMPVGDRLAPVSADGEFVLRGLGRDTFRVQLVQPRPDVAGAAPCSVRVEVQAGSHGVELRYDPGLEITFRVVDAVSEAAIERLWVASVLRGGGGIAELMQRQRGAGPARDYPGGRVTIPNLRPKAKQKLSLTVEALGYAPCERDGIELPARGSLDLGTLRLEPRAVVEVTVLAADTGAPVPGAKVQLVAADTDLSNPLLRMAAPTSGGASTARTDRDGRCRLNPLSAPQLRVVVDSQQFAGHTSAPFAPAERGVTTHEVRLSRGGLLQLKVVSHDEQPLAAAVVEQRAPGGERRQHKTDARGMLQLQRQLPGEHAFRLGRDEGMMGLIRLQMQRDNQDDAAGWTTVAVSEGGAAELVLRQQPTAVLSGFVRELGRPLAGARIAFVPGDSEGPEAMALRMAGDMAGGLLGGGGRSSKSDDLGGYRLTDLPPGAHRPRITHRERAVPTEVEVTLQLGANTFDIELPATELRGIVRDPDGLPVADAKVSVGVLADPTSAFEIGGVMQDVMPGFGGGGATIKTDDAGAFTLRGVPVDQELRVQVTAKGFAAAARTVRVGANETPPSLVLQLGRAGKVKVTVATEAPFVMVTAEFADESAGVDDVHKLLSKGKGTLDGLRPGRWQIRCEAEGDEREGGGRAQTVEVVAGETVSVQF